MWARRVVLVAVIVATSSAGVGDEKIEQIPLESVFTMRSLEPGWQADPQGAELYERFLRWLPQTSNIFFTHGRDEKEAFRAALRFEARNDVPARDGKVKLWLAAFLGYKQGTKLNMVEYSDREITLHFSVKKPLQSSRESNPYFYLVPIRAPKAHGCELRLYDADAKRVVLVRTVRLQDLEEQK